MCLNLSEKLRDFRNFPDSAKECSRKKKHFLYGFYIVLVLVSTIALGLCSMLLAYGSSYSAVVFFKYFTNGYLIYLNLMPPVALFFILFGILRRAWIAYLVDSIVVLTLSCANHFMLMFRNDPLMFSDILYLREAIEISKEGYNYVVTPEIAFGVVTTLIFTVLLFVFRTKKPPLKTCLYFVIVSAIICVLSSGAYTDADIYDKKTDVIDEAHMNRWSPTNQYLSKGFVYPFLHSVKGALKGPPEGYDENTARELLENYTYSSIPEDKKVNVVAVMLEAFCDIESLGIEGINDEAYANYRRIRDENLHGTLVTNIFAAGTVDSERAFISGFTGLEHCRRKINSYVRYFESEGYFTSGSHPSEDWFYNRRNVNDYIGFSEYLFKENHYEARYGEYMRNDNVVFDDIFGQLVDRTKNCEKPYFGMHVTYQGHGPYATSYRGWGTDENPLYTDDSVSEESANIINNYLGSLRSTGEHLGRFVDNILDYDEPVVLLIYGDHKPWLGDSNSVYEELGISFDLSTKEGFLNYYATEYIIVANDKAKEILGKEFVGEGPMTSPCFLMNVLFDEMGFEGPSFMKYTDKVRETIAAVNHEGIIDTLGNFYSVDYLPKGVEKVYSEYLNVCYYERTNLRK